MKVVITTSPKYRDKKESLVAFFQENPPLDLLYKFSGRRCKSIVNIQHKPLKLAADFRDRTVLIDFRNPVEYIYLGVCHEMAHILLRQKPAWYKNKAVNRILQRYKNFRSKRYQYSFQYAVEQTIATFLQAACESEAGLRPLQWSKWLKTFQALDIIDIAKVLFPEFKRYLKNLDKWSTIDAWILSILTKHFNVP